MMSVEPSGLPGDVSGEVSLAIVCSISGRLFLTCSPADEVRNHGAIDGILVVGGCVAPSPAALHGCTP